MVSHMKTTIHIADALYEEARSIASRDSTTIRALVEEGLLLVLERRRRAPEPFSLRRATVTGHGLQAGIAEGDWVRLREAAYEGRGG